MYFEAARTPDRGTPVTGKRFQAAGGLIRHEITDETVGSCRYVQSASGRTDAFIEVGGLAVSVATTPAGERTVQVADGSQIMGQWPLLLAARHEPDPLTGYPPGLPEYALRNTQAFRPSSPGTEGCLAIGLGDGSILAVHYDSPEQPELITAVARSGPAALSHDGARKFAFLLTTDEISLIGTDQHARTVALTDDKQPNSVPHQHSPDGGRSWPGKPGKERPI